MWKFSYSTNACRSDRRARQLRKSERLRFAEMEILRLTYEIEYVKSILSVIADFGLTKQEAPDLDAGKWYLKKQNKPDIPNN